MPSMRRGGVEGEWHTTLAVRLAQAGADVVINHRDSVQEAEKVAERVRGLGRRALIVQADVAQPADADRLMGASLEQLGRVDILVNSQRIMHTLPGTVTTARWGMGIRSR